MHTVLNLKSNGRASQDDKTLEQRLVESGSCSFLVHDNGSQLLVITNKHDLLTSEYQWDHALWFGRLGRLVDENSAELHLGETRITSTNARTADDIGCHQDLTFSCASELLELLLILTRQLAHIALQ